jgi:hypothetical protein
VTLDVTANDHGTVTAPAIVNGPNNGRVHAAGRAFVYTPDPEFAGTDTFSYRICAVSAPDLCAEATVSITVSAAVGPTPTPPPPPTPPPAADESSGSLPGTGSDVGGWGWLGFLAVVTGVTLLIAQSAVRRSRRRRRTP